MSAPSFGLSTMPVPVMKSPMLLQIERALLALVYTTRN
jgi:hypothetical protein